MTWIEAIYLALQQIPVLEGYVQDFIKLYMENQLAAHNTDLATAVIGIIQQRDQTLFEKAIGSANAGQSGLDQTGTQDRPVGGGES